MEKPECPECKAEMLVQERYITVSYVDELESGDPCMPNPGDREKEWADENYHPHYWCPECNKYFGFNMLPIPFCMVGRDDSEPWHQDDIQFPRLICEIAANVCISDDEFRELCESMDLPRERVAELFDRARAAWERYKEDLTKRERIIEFDHEGTPVIVTVTDPNVDIDSIEISISKTGKRCDLTPARRLK